MGKKCTHKKIKRKMIEEGKREGTYRAFCSQQCKKMKDIIITTDDVKEVYYTYKKGD